MDKGYKPKELRATMISELKKNNVSKIGNIPLDKLQTPKIHTWYEKLGMNMKLIAKYNYINYDKYLLSEEWYLLRQKAIKEVNNKCQNCSSQSNLEVHHTHYNSLGKEQLKDVNVLCETCHTKLHEIGKTDYRYLRISKFNNS